MNEELPEEQAPVGDTAASDTATSEAADLEDAPQPEPPKPDHRAVPEIVQFERPFFNKIEGACFRLTEDTQEPVLVMPFETGDVSLRFPGIVNELKLEEDDPDHIMLNTVAEGLQFVQRLEVGDDVPSELLSGRASWEVTDMHRQIAKSRVSMQLVSWLTGDEVDLSDPDALAKLAQDPEVKTKVDTAFDEAAQQLGLGSDSRDKVVSLVENLAEELAYIESLRSTFQDVRDMARKIGELRIKYRAEMTVMEVINPVVRLMKIAFDGFRNEFEELDAQTGEIIATLKNIGPQTRYIRGKRDELHRRLWAWSGLLKRWRKAATIKSRMNEQLLADTYHFLALRFLPQQEWELLTKAHENAKKLATEKIW